LALPAPAVPAKRGGGQEDMGAQRVGWTESKKHMTAKDKKSLVFFYFVNELLKKAKEH
jgi:hypothetical protein